MGKIRIVAVSGPADREAHTTIWQGDEDAVPDFFTVPCGLLRGVREIRTIREEEPEVLWEAPETEDVWAVRILLDGTVQAQDEGEWGNCDCPTTKELARRLLEEHKQQEALDEHNDEVEEAASNDRAIWSTLNKHQDRLDAFDSTVTPDIDRRLTKLEQDLLLVRGQAAHVDEREAADFEATQIRLGVPEEWRSAARDLPAGVDAMREVLGEPLSPSGVPSVTLSLSEYRRLRAIDELWGPEGELRNKLATRRLVGLAPTQLEQLRSELLAVPPEFLFEKPAFFIDESALNTSAELPVEGEIRPASAPSASRPDTPSGNGR